MSLPTHHTPLISPAGPRAWRQDVRTRAPCTIRRLPACTGRRRPRDFGVPNVHVHKGASGLDVETPSVIVSRQEEPTLEEFLRWPEQKPYLEFIRGKVRPKAVPDQFHSLLLARLTAMLHPWSESIQGWTLTEQRCVLVVVDELREVVLPDVAWWSIAQLPALAGGPVNVAPTLAVEILSPDDRYGDVQDKVVQYLRAGVAVVWVVDPRSRNATVYRSGTEPDVVSPPGRLHDDALPGLEISLTELFARLPADDARPRIQEQEASPHGRPD